MSIYPSTTVAPGAPIVSSETFLNSAGTAFDPVTVDVKWDGPGLTATTWTYPTNTQIVKVSVGVYTVSIPSTVSGEYHVRWEGKDGTGTIQNADEYVFLVGVETVGAASSWPYAQGYCDVSDITARVLSGSWDPLNNKQERPSVSQVERWIQEYSSAMDLALGKAGYTLPLTTTAGATGSNLPIQVVAHLRNICAQAVAGEVEAARHGAFDKNKDSQAEFRIKFYDDLMARLENGTDPLTLFGIEGAWEPDPDPAQAIQIGNLTDLSGNAKTPIFTTGSLGIFDPTINANNPF